jgi:site-specific recombinase XerD
VQTLKQRLQFPDEKTLTPHIFRHTGATHLRQNGMDISELQDLLGHANPNTTKIYAKNDIMHLAKSFQKYHPLSNE